MYNPRMVKLDKDRYIQDEFTAGEGCTTKVTASIGTSTSRNSHKEELEKALISVSAGANIVSDHSVTGNIPMFHKTLRTNLSVPLSSLPIYELSSNYMYKNKHNISAKEVLELIETQLFRGINILSLHATIYKKDIIEPISRNRVIPITSKGGLMMMEYINATKEENPFYAYFDDILKIFKKYNSIISLAPTYRPASVCDNSMDDNDAHWIEIKRMAFLVEKAIKEEVPIMVEGVGHALMSNIPKYVSETKKICQNVPYRVLTVSTDIALGYDVIASAIASSIAALNGANIITAVTSAEHIGLPNVKQIEEAVVSAKIAAHSADLCVLDDLSKDMNMSLARANIGNCLGAIEEAIYPNAAKNLFVEFSEGCGMCGDFCALKRAKNGD